jgi:hypothetical protein
VSTGSFLHFQLKQNKESEYPMNEDEHWLNRKRLSLYPPIFLVLFLIVGYVWVRKFNNMVDLNGGPFGYDFIVFWAASHLALTGHAQDACNIHLLFKSQQIAVPSSQGGYMWLYPPQFFLVVLPLAFLPYIASFWTFMLSTLGAYLLVLRRIVRGSTAMWCMSAFSGLWLNLFLGQNAFLTAALCGAALLSLEHRPLLAGFFIGLLSIKPHLALLFPVVLIAIGAWRAMITAAVTAITFTVAATATLGTAVLDGFLTNLGYARLCLENDSNVWRKMPSVFAFMRLLGISVTWAYVLHGIVAVGAVIVVWYVWRCCRNPNLRGAALMTATFLVSPYAYFYDLVWISFPIVWLALEGLDNGWLRGERTVLAVAWLLPMLMWAQIPANLRVQVGPLVLCCLLWIVYRRAKASSRDVTEATSSGEANHLDALI